MTTRFAGVSIVAAGVAAGVLAVVAGPRLASGDSGNSWGKRALHIQEHLDGAEPLAGTTWVDTHNSFANPKDSDMSDYNQPLSIEQQLEHGARELVFDVHYEGGGNGNKGDVVLCHDNRKKGHCVGGTTGYTMIGRPLNAIVDWVHKGHEDSVIMLKLSLHPTAKRHINQIEKKLRKQLGDLLYRPDASGHHGDIDPKTGCTKLTTDTVTKRDVLDAGKNVILYVTESCYSDGGFNNLVFYGTTTVISKKLDKLKVATDKDKVMYRVKDGATRDAELNPKHDVKIQPNNVQDWLDAGLNIFEMYGYAANDRKWKVDQEHPVQPEQMVWSWAVGQPDGAAGHDEDCARYDGGRFHDYPCDRQFTYACYANDEWTLTSITGAWSDGFDACAAAGASFRAPVNKPELNALRDVVTAANNSGPWINYTDQILEGRWLANAASKDAVDALRFRRTAAHGGNGGSAFDDIQRTAVDLYRTDKRRVAKVVIATDKHVTKFGFVYEDGRSVTHGKGKSKEWVLAKKDYITKVEVCIDHPKKKSDRVYYIKVTTPTMSMAAGKRTGTCSTVDAAGGEIFAMFGRAGDAVDQLGFYYRDH